MKLRNSTLLAATLIGCSHPMTKAVQSHDLVAACHARSSEQYENNIPPETLSAYKSLLLAQTDIRWKLETIKTPEVKGVSDSDTQRAATFYRLTVSAKQLPEGFTAHLSPGISMDGKEYELIRLLPPKSKEKTDSRTFFELASGYTIGKESCDYVSEHNSFTGDLAAALLSTFGSGEAKARLD